ITSLHDLMEWGRAAGLDPVGLRIGPSELGRVPLPAVVHMEPNHFVALVSMDDRFARIVDGGVERRAIPRSTL
ncbi:MAG: hypothetical protein K8E66_04890, partial [Phycisphaerales bacterium]|nr:hypothetical protein [Phycisphaerales bacterium]